jgi:hypothetical protein
MPLLFMAIKWWFSRRNAFRNVSHGKAIRTYTVASGGDPVGAKTRQGDHKTPEGGYALDSRHALSQFYQAIHISHASSSDRAVARHKASRQVAKFFCTSRQVVGAG